MNCIGQFIISTALVPRVQLLRYGFNSRYRHVAGKWSLEVGWWSFSVRQTQRHGIGTVDVFDLLVRITCIFLPSCGKSQPFSDITYDLRPTWKNWPSCGNRPIWKNRPSCVSYISIIYMSI